jgi:hypothetical protein
MKKGILIDVKNRTITEVEVIENAQGSQLESIYKHLGCSTFEVVNIDEQNDVYVDEEGLLFMDDNTMFFQMDNGQPLAGNGLIMGYDDETGDSVDTTLSVEEVTSRVKFHTAFEVALKTRFNM